MRLIFWVRIALLLPLLFYAHDRKCEHISVFIKTMILLCALHHGELCSCGGVWVCEGVCVCARGRACKEEIVCVCEWEG